MSRPLFGSDAALRVIRDRVIPITSDTSTKSPNKTRRDTKREILTVRWAAQPRRTSVQTFEAKPEYQHLFNCKRI